MLKIRSYLGSIIDKLSYLAMVITFFLVCMTTVDVVLRKLTHFSILGSYELTEMGMVIVLWIAIAYYQVSKGHIRVTMFVDMMPKRLQLFLAIITNLLGTVIISFCIYAAVLRVQGDMAKNLKTAVLLIPQFPFATFMVIGQILFVLLLLIDTITAISDFVKYKKPIEQN